MEDYNLATATTAPEENTTPVVTTSDDEPAFIVDLTSRRTSYCSMIADTPEKKATLYNAMNNPEKRIKDCINEVIEISDIYVEVVRLINEETGVVSSAPRIVLITKDGIGYQCVSVGIYSALQKLIQVYGEPINWVSPIKVKIRQISKGTRNLLTLDIAK